MFTANLRYTIHNGLRQLVNFLDPEPPNCLGRLLVDFHPALFAILELVQVSPVQLFIGYQQFQFGKCPRDSSRQARPQTCPFF